MAIDENTLTYIREAEKTSPLFMGDGAAATIAILLAHNEDPELTARAVYNICTASWTTQRQPDHFALHVIKERWLALASALAKVSDHNTRLLLFHHTRNSTKLGQQLNLDLILTMVWGREREKPSTAGGGDGVGATGGDDGGHSPEMLLKAALENLTAVLSTDPMPADARTRVQAAHDQVKEALATLAAENEMPPPP